MLSAATRSPVLIANRFMTFMTFTLLLACRLQWVPLPKRSIAPADESGMNLGREFCDVRHKGFVEFVSACVVQR
jgi:hypothetical protein